jgi:hypothetical protein
VAESIIGTVIEVGSRWLRYGYALSPPRCCCPPASPDWPRRDSRKFLTAAAASGADEEALKRRQRCHGSGQHLRSSAWTLVPNSSRHRQEI